MTFAEISEAIKGYKKTQRYNDDLMLTAAWYTAYLTRVKKMPQLKDILINDEKPKQQTSEQMLEMAKIINAALGGDEI